MKCPSKPGPLGVILSHPQDVQQETPAGRIHSIRWCELPLPSWTWWWICDAWEYPWDPRDPGWGSLGEIWGSDLHILVVFPPTLW